jgi:hypothetical protein
MSNIHRVAIEIEPADAKSGNPGRVSYGYYRVEGNKLIMTGEDGAALVDRQGNRYGRELGPADDPAFIARLLTRRIRDKVIGESAGFNRRIVYPDTPVV